MKQLFDLAVIGGGVGGYVAAIRGAQKGNKTVLIEAAEMGGTCLNRGCIPSKAMIANAEAVLKMKKAADHGIKVDTFTFDYNEMKIRKDKIVEKLRKGVEGLIRANQITLISGFGTFVSPHEIEVKGKESTLIEAKKIIVATGSEPLELPFLPVDHETIYDSTSFLNITALPKSLLVIGAGIIGCEFASLHAALGVEVTLLELLPTILSTEGKTVSDAIALAFKKRGIKIETNVAVERLQKENGGVKTVLADGRSFTADRALVAVGRRLNTGKVGLDKAGVKVDEKGRVPVNDHMQTNVSHIYAIGDITGKWLLAHVASHQGIVAADHASGGESAMHYNAVPSAIFTHPEVGTVGFTQEKALEKGYQAEVCKYPFQALGKSQATLESDGFAQIVFDKGTGQILGAQVIGYEASALIAEMTLAIANELTLDSVADTMHAHPTISEAWMEAALVGTGWPIHLPPIKKREG